MFGAIGVDLIFEMMKRDGYMQQLPLFLTPPNFEIDEQYLCSVYKGIKCTVSSEGSSYSSHGTEDHPAFSALREHLGSKGYIHIERSWCNGDRVLHGFSVNGAMFYPGEKFVCASAMEFTLASKTKYQDQNQLLPIRIPWNEQEQPATNTVW